MKAFHMARTHASPAHLRQGPFCRLRAWQFTPLAVKGLTGLAIIRAETLQVKTLQTKARLVVLLGLSAILASCGARGALQPPPDTPKQQADKEIILDPLIRAGGDRK